MPSNDSSKGSSDLQQALDTARRTMVILEKQAVGYTSLTIHAHLKIELKDKRREVQELENELRELEEPVKPNSPIPGSEPNSKPRPKTSEQTSIIVAIIGVIVAIIGTISALMYPEFRQWLKSDNGD